MLKDACDNLHRTCIFKQTHKTPLHNHVVLLMAGCIIAYQADQLSFCCIVPPTQTGPEPDSDPVGEAGNNKPYCPSTEGMRQMPFAMPSIASSLQVASRGRRGQSVHDRASLVQQRPFLDGYNTEKNQRPAASAAAAAAEAIRSSDSSRSFAAIDLATCDTTHDASNASNNSKRASKPYGNGSVESSARTVKEEAVLPAATYKTITASQSRFAIC